MSVTWAQGRTECLSRSAHRIPLEISPTSNIRLGFFHDFAAHPLARLHDAGVIVTVNSDDPPLFNTTFNDEVALLADPFHLSVDAIDEILLNGVRHSFLPAERRQAMEAAFRSELAILKEKYLPELTVFIVAEPVYPGGGGLQPAAVWSFGRLKPAATTIR